MADAAHSDLRFAPEFPDAHRYAMIIEWYPEDSDYVVIITDLPWFQAEGRTRAEAVSNAEEALEVYLGILKDQGVAVSEPSFSQLPAYLRSEAPGANA